MEKETEERKLIKASERIPPITDPMGKAWRQPPLDLIAFDSETGHAVMALDTFKMIPDYTMSQPTGAYEGKMWRFRHAIKRDDKGNIVLSRWYLCWFVPSADKPETHLSTKHAPIRLRLVARNLEAKADAV